MSGKASGLPGPMLLLWESANHWSIIWAAPHHLGQLHLQTVALRQIWLSIGNCDGNGRRKKRIFIVACCLAGVAWERIKILLHLIWMDDTLKQWEERFTRRGIEWNINWVGRSLAHLPFNVQLVYSTVTKQAALIGSLLSLFKFQERGFWKEIAGSFTKYLHLKVLLLGRTYFFLTIFGGQSPWRVDAISLGARFLRGLKNFKTLTLWSSCYALPLFSYNKGFVERKWTFEVKLCCDIANKKVKCINGRLFCDLSLWASHQYFARHIFDSQHYLVKVGWLVINQRVKADKGSC